MRSLNGWQPARFELRTCVLLMEIFSRKNLAIFHVFGDFLLRSRFIYLMFFEIHRILLTPESDLRNFGFLVKRG